MSSHLKYADKKYVFLTDFDGTITEVDSNDHMVDTVGMGYTERRKINEKIITEKVSYREGFRTMIESVHRPFEEMEALVKKGESLQLEIILCQRSCTDDMLPVSLTNNLFRRTS